MSSRTIKQDRALLWFVETHNLIPQLSAHPIYRFKRRDNGKLEEHDMRFIESSYKVMLAERAKERRKK